MAIKERTDDMEIYADRWVVGTFCAYVDSKDEPDMLLAKPGHVFVQRDKYPMRGECVMVPEESLHDHIKRFAAVVRMLPIENEGEEPALRYSRTVGGLVDMHDTVGYVLMVNDDDELTEEIRQSLDAAAVDYSETKKEGDEAEYVL